MFKQGNGYVLIIVIFALIFLNFFLFSLDFKDRNKGLTFSMLDVGQGDALFIESPTGVQVLVDVGPPRKIISALSGVMSPFDRSIDAIIITNPDLDHLGGFVDVVKKYKVGKVFEPGTFNESRAYENFKSEIKNKNIENILARQGMRMDLGGGVVIDILFPDRDVSWFESNDGSVIAKLTYGETSVMLMGDATNNAEEMVLEDYNTSQLASDILKVGHHGSRTSSSEEFVKAVAPLYAFISSGKSNSYGHPHEEVLDTFSLLRAKIFRTDTLGTIVVKSDGQDMKFICDTIAPCETN